MYLKALEIQGFKSFPDKTRLTFEKDVTAIVGPNGSGKSNLSDAVLWVLGEQSTKTLRGSKMEDVIFGGTAQRNPLGFAEVSLIIDNSAHIFDSDSAEIQITRRYYRSGESEYMINREQVRLKDVNGLLMDTGLGRDGYSVIGQGRIAEIISTKSTDRREVFDEAAGISRYRYRKEEAERRLEKTDANLLRIDDKIEELELQVGPLKHQSENAKKYLVLRDELKVREVSAWMESLDRVREREEAVKLEYEQASCELDKARSDLDSLYASSESLSERMHSKDEQSEEARERLSAAENAASEIDSCIQVLKTKVQSRLEAMEKLRSDISSQEERAGEISRNLEENGKRLQELALLRKSTEEERAANENVLSGCRMKISSREGDLDALSEKASSLSADIRFTASRINMLREMEKEFEGHSKAVRAVMKESGRGTLRGIHAPLANLLRSDEECALAIETALGAAGGHIVTDSREAGRAAIEMLKRTDSGRATFLPLDTIRASALSNCPESEYGFVGLASELVSFEEKYRAVVESVLGKTIVVEALSDAIRISKKYNDIYKIVTLDGQQINPGGSMTGGSSSKSSGILTRANEKEKLEKKLTELKAQEENCAQRLNALKTELSGLRYNLDMANADRTEILSKESSLEAEEKSFRLSTEQFRVLLLSISGDSGQRRAALEEGETEISLLKKEISKKEEEYSGALAAAEKIREEISGIASERLELEGKRTRAEGETKEVFARITELERSCARIEQRKLSAEMEERQLTDRLWDSYELSWSSAEKIRLEVESLAKLNREIASLRKDISALGNVNLGAIEEYERVRERYEFFVSQRRDIDDARRELLGIIREVTNEMKEVFITQFRLIDEQFRKTFSDLFGGGKAELRLEDEADILNCGIEIKVQPPGKNVTSISLLSGGEKAFVAIALYFAILKVRPTPFCIMDEIEAALDEANVSRFAEYLRGISGRTQFIVITHRRGTMEEADMLYGVTMQEKGVSTVLELDLEQARKNAED